MNHALFARSCLFSKCDPSLNVAKLTRDSHLTSVQTSHAMTLNTQDLIAKWLKQAIDEHESSQAALANLLGLDPSAVSKIIQGKRKITAEELLIAAAYYDTPLPLIPGIGQASKEARSNDNSRLTPPPQTDAEADLLKTAFRYVDEQLAKSDSRLSNKQYLDRVYFTFERLEKRNKPA
ncbi:helix-turn-helix transcriptional regulator [Roseibium polysiphoniae]|uniref:helix-turn-helix domain-containing protein n=1 Tax=Roseibium polysiphoniae TaxID=2571221 RepID=UPI003297FBCE